MKSKLIPSLGIALVLALSAGTASAGLTSLANAPLVTSSTTEVLPNVMFVLDDSGSMGWDYLPDWAGSYSGNLELFRNNDFNGVAYSPAVTYSPPVMFDTSGARVSTTYPSQGSPWSAVRNDGYRVQSTGTSDLRNNADFYTFIPGEYCASPNLRNCSVQSAPTASYPYPATLRWCDSAALTTCQANWSSGSFTNARYPRQSTSTITVGGSGSTSVTGVAVTGLLGGQILSAATAANTSTSTVASRIRDSINACTDVLVGNCTVTGYSAALSGSTVTITGPGGLTAVAAPAKSGTMNVTHTLNDGGGPGANIHVNIVATNNSYPYPGKTTKASTRSDCAGATCTYAEEMTNYANWYAYYRTRMQMMKTSTSLAFDTIGANYRLGYMSINNNTGADFLNLNKFETTQKNAWYQKLFAAQPNNRTPLLGALSQAGRLFSGGLNGSTFNGSRVTDPMQYSCQQNFTILSTDGYWNQGIGFGLDGRTPVGSPDSSEPRPYYDGAGSRTIYTATLSISGTNNNFSVSGILVNGAQVLYDSTSGSRQENTVASRITDNINACTNILRGNCTVTGFSASWTSTGSNSAAVTITYSGSGAISGTPSVSSSGSGTISASPFTSNVIVTGGASDTLADVAEYYYITDLRAPALGNCTGAVVPPAVAGNTLCSTATPDPYNNVPGTGLDNASWQHMTTFTLGLGASGRMLFSPNYASASSGDYFDVKNGTSANPSGGICTWQTSGACNWPVPTADAQETIDDLWHAAVNGRGTYFSATNPASLSAGLNTALAGVSARLGAAAAATTSNPNVTSGDNFVFSSTFTTSEWTGELVRQQLDLTTGVVSATPDWEASAALDSNSARNIYTFDGAAASHLKSFTWASMSATERAYFSTPHIGSLSQFCVSGVSCLSAADQTLASGANLLNFVRGERSHEGPITDTSAYYRLRTHVLGDIVSAEALYVKGSLWNYADAGYSAYVTATRARQSMVYAAANDGMLHAFNASTGAESWAYVPSLVLPELYRLADKNYGSLHRFIVDGTPIAGDVYFAGAWHTIVVGGLNGGGRGYYALDVTNPATPVALWEFTDANLGYTYGNPVITKLADGTWVVLVASGYNNTVPGDGVGRLYVLNAATGAVIRTISTGVGSVTTPSGLARINAWVDFPETDNTTLRVYGGDLLGNLWRFDINGNVGAPGYDAQRLITFYADAAGTIPQSITAKPELGEVNSRAVVFVGTGRYLGGPDVGDTTQQSFYAVMDELGSTTLTNPRAGASGFVKQDLTTTTCPPAASSSVCTVGQPVRVSTQRTVNFGINKGWYIDLPDAGERATNDPTLALGTLGFTTNIPRQDACTSGGYSYRYLVDYRTGAPVSTWANTGIVAVQLGNALSTRGVFVRLPTNVIVQLTRLSDGTTVTTNVPVGSGANSLRRVSWRELTRKR